MKIGTAIRKLRRDRDLRQNDLANSIGITQSYLSGIEKGKKTPSVDVLSSISDYFKMPLAVIYWEALSEDDIHPSKLESFRILKPSVDGLINQMFKQ
jgi:transcriptional regulator with XRE-family HTH domain